MEKQKEILKVSDKETYQNLPIAENTQTINEIAINDIPNDTLTTQMTKCEQMTQTEHQQEIPEFDYQQLKTELKQRISKKDVPAVSVQPSVMTPVSGIRQKVQNAILDQGIALVTSIIMMSIPMLIRSTMSSTMPLRSLPHQQSENAQPFTSISSELQI